MDVKTKATRQKFRERREQSSRKRKAEKADQDTASDERLPLQRMQARTMVGSERKEENGAVEATLHRRVAAAASNACESYDLVQDNVYEK